MTSRGCLAGSPSRAPRARSPVSLAARWQRLPASPTPRSEIRISPDSPPPLLGVDAGGDGIEAHRPIDSSGGRSASSAKGSSSPAVGTPFVRCLTRSAPGTPCVSASLLCADSPPPPHQVHASSALRGRSLLDRLPGYRVERGTVHLESCGSALLRGRLAGDPPVALGVRLLVIHPPRRAWGGHARGHSAVRRGGRRRRPFFDCRG